MSTTAQPAAADAPEDHCITLSGSAELVTEFFAYSVNTLLYQRGIYPPESFARVSKYGMTMLVSTDKAVENYLKSVLEQMSIWLARAELDRVAVVISSVATSDVLERWVFNVKTDAAGAGAPNQDTGAPKTKAQAKIMAEIQALVRQITASVTFLPLLDEPCSFDMLIYTKKDAETPALWDESGPRIIPRSHEVQLRSFSTSLHNVDACVAFARSDE
jgi:mitotic spindle assembly checkpoint protein MAD2